MRRILTIAMLLMWVRVGYANEEMTVELPGGATMEFVWIPPGIFTMGTTRAQEQLLRDKGMWRDDSRSSEQPAFEVTIRQGFWLGKFELTQGQWETVMGTTPWGDEERMLFKDDGPAVSDATYPAMYISWDHMQSFIATLHETTGDSLYRLPSEAEWEYACRAGTNTLWFFGNDESDLGNYACDRTSPVGTKWPNPWGLYDMYGNLSEWCQDWRSSYSSEAQVDPTGPETGSYRVHRGFFGSLYPEYAHSAFRSSVLPQVRHEWLGARLLRMGPQLTHVTPESWGQIKADP